MHLDIKVEVPQLGTVTVDVAWGGMFYVISDAAQFGLKVTPDEGRAIQPSQNAPEERRRRGHRQARLEQSRHLDRRDRPLALRHWHRGEDGDAPCPGQLGLNEDFHHEGILGTVFTGRLVEETRVGPYQAVVPTISGTAWITGMSQYGVDPSDPFPNGFKVGDIW